MVVVWREGRWLFYGERGDGCCMVRGGDCIFTKAEQVFMVQMEMVGCINSVLRPYRNTCFFLTLAKEHVRA